MTTDISVVRWDPTLQQEIVEEYEYDGGNSSSRLFERSRIKALAGENVCYNSLIKYFLLSRTPSQILLSYLCGSELPLHKHLLCFYFNIF